MKGAVLGIDTSNYRTSASAIDLNGHVLFSERRLLPVATGQRGLRQNDAAFSHLKILPGTLTPLQNISKEYEIVAVCASTRPRDPEDSYMPVFRVGETVGRSIALSKGIPFYATTHQRGHIAAALKDTQYENEKQFLAFHLSGGTTDLIKVNDAEIELLGTSRDLHAGQLIDRIGVAMGLPFPSGPQLEKLAAQGKSSGIIGTSLDHDRINCHFSGAETKAMELMNNGQMNRENIAREVFDVLARTAAKMIRTASSNTKIKNILIGGGIASSFLFRKMLQTRCDEYCHDINIIHGSEELCGDNAVGVALIGLKQYIMNPEASYEGTDSGR